MKIQTDKFKFKRIKEDQDNFKIECFINGNKAGFLTFERVYDIFEDNFFTDDEFESMGGPDVLNEYFTDSSFLYIKYLEVYPNFLKRGVANSLMQQFLVDFHKQQNTTVAFLNAAPYLTIDNKKIPLPILTMFYEKFGFQVIHYDKANNLMIYKK